MQVDEFLPSVGGPYVAPTSMSARTASFRPERTTWKGARASPRRIVRLRRSRGPRARTRGRNASAMPTVCERLTSAPNVLCQQVAAALYQRVGSSALAHDERPTRRRRLPSNAGSGRAHRHRSAPSLTPGVVAIPDRPLGTIPIVQSNDVTRAAAKGRSRSGTCGQKRRLSR